jgi:hypothetical protein
MDLWFLSVTGMAVRVHIVIFEGYMTVLNPTGDYSTPKDC